METARYQEMKESFEDLRERGKIQDIQVVLFGHCEATLKLADLFYEQGIEPKAILDNSQQKWGVSYRNIPVCSPEEVLQWNTGSTSVFIVSRFYEAMNTQLRRMGYQGEIYKLVDYNSFAEYSLSEDTIIRKRARAERGAESLRKLKMQHPSALMVFCPFQALGDVYLAMSYLPHFKTKKHIGHSVVCVVGRACGKVARLFEHSEIIELTQTEMDEAVQGAIYTQDPDCFIAHQDRPYVVYLHRALYLKCIPLDTIYRCGVFGLPQDTSPVVPTRWKDYQDKTMIDTGNTVILSPYAKSVPALPEEFWNKVVRECKARGFRVLTNVAGEEKPLLGTLAISPDISEIKSVVEQAGLFIGIRSGLCDVLQTANCRKIALYPDYYYCDTRWKAVEMYSLPGFENIVFDGGLSWLNL